MKNLNLAWAYQSPNTGSWQPTPLVVDGIMYLTQRPNDVIALDAVTGRVFWIYRYNNSADLAVCCGSNNRGLAILGDTLFMGTLDAHLVAIDTKSGMPVWKTKVAESKAGYSLTVAPLAVGDKVIVGVGGGEWGIRGFISAYHAQTGKELWKFYTIPAPGEPGHETWEPCPPNPATYCDPEGWKHGGGSVWVTGSYDPALNLTYWGTGNVGPGLQPRTAARRQPLHGVGRGAGYRHRQAEVALPVHAARSLRLRFGAGAGSGRHHLSGRARQGADVGQSQRQLSTCSTGPPGSFSWASRS